MFNEFFKKDLVLINKTYSNKKDALKNFAKILVENNYATNADIVLEMALKREKENSTGIGEEIAIPHIRDNVMNKSVILFAKVKPLNWDSIDNKKVKFIFFIALNPKNSSSHMEVLASLMKLFMNADFKNELENVSSYEELKKLINKYDSIKEIKSIDKNKDSVYDVVAITACPTGIAHTFMARDMLEKAAKEMNVKIKVETQGADGSKNILTNEEIKNAKGVIIAVDRIVDLSRFSQHSNVLEMGTKPVIKDAKKEIQKILDNKGSKIQVNKNNDSTNDSNTEMSFNKFGKRAYKSLLTGVSYMLPFVIFGGILIALAFLFDMKNAGSNDFGSGNSVSKWTKQLGDLAFGLMVPILAAYITFAIVGRQGLLPGFMVGLIAKGDFFFYLNPENGNIQWLLKPGDGNPPGASSGVFGAIGGAFLAASILILLSKLFALQINTKNGKKNWFPNSLNGIKNILLIPLFGTFVIVITFWITNIPLIYLNWGFTKFLELFEDKEYLSWLLGLIIAAMMSVDLGGPINKAAYVFATATLATAGGKGTIVMAASMAGGMSAPIGIALSCTFFKKLWDKEDRQSGYINYIMGLTFISEGAIPLTLKKPKIMIPSNIIGSAITGILIGVLGVRIAAPHGGILTIALAKCNLFDNEVLSTSFGVVFFIVALIAGSITSMFCIWLFTKIFTNKNQQKKSKLESNNFSKKDLKQKNYKNNLNFNLELKLINNLLIK